MQLLKNLTYKNLKLNKKRSVVVVIGIVLSCALLTAISSLYVSFINSIINYEIEFKGDYHVGFNKVPKNDIATISNNYGVDSYFLTADIGYSKLSSTNDYKPYAFVTGYDKDALNKLGVNLKSGRLPQNSNEIVIPAHLKTNGNIEINIGDDIELEVGKRYNDGVRLNQNSPYAGDTEIIKDTVKQKYKVVGIMQRPDYTVEPWSAPGYTMITLMDNNNSYQNYNVYARLNKSGLKKPYKVTANILNVDEELFNSYSTGKLLNDADNEKIIDLIAKAKYEYSTNEYLISLETNPLSISSNQTMGVVVAIVVIIIIVASVFCIKNSFDISISEKTKQYGILKSIGATKKQIKKNVFYEAFLLGIFGIPLGVLFGNLASFILIMISNKLLASSLNIDISLQFSFSIIAILLGVFFEAVTIYFSSKKSAVKASKISPIESIRNSGEIKINAKKLRIPPFINKFFGIGGVISYKNIKRNKKKYRTTVISITVSVAIFIALAYFTGGMKRAISSEFRPLEYNVTMYGSFDYSLKEFNAKMSEVENNPDVNNMTVLKYAYGTIKNPDYRAEYLKYAEETQKQEIIQINTVGNREYKNFLKKLNLNEEDFINKGILIDSMKLNDPDSDKVIEFKDSRLNTKIGDIIELTVEEKPYNFEIGFITSEYPFAIYSSPSMRLIVSEDMYAKIEPNEYAGYVDCYFDAENTEKFIDDMKLSFDDSTFNYNDLNSDKKKVSDVLLLANIFLYGFIIVISLIGITNIFNTITTNINLRKQEFATLKSVGMTKHEFNKLINLESIFIGMKSLFWGILIGLALSYLMYYYLDRSLLISFKIPFEAITICIIFVLLLITTLMKYSVSQINKQNVIETIRNENI